MKRLSLFFLLNVVFQTVLYAQDYKVTGMEFLQNDMTARKVILTEKVNGGGQQCAVLRIATQNILDLQRDLFQFECDMGSVIRERRRDGGEICLWVSPGIKILKIKHNNLGNYILSIPEMLGENVQSLNTYRISIVGLKELPKETLAYGKCQMVFQPNPEEASLFVNGDSIGTGIHTITSLSGVYHWEMKHPLYQSEQGTIELVKGKIDSVIVNLKPIYGYISILSSQDSLNTEALKVFIDGKPKGDVPFKSEKLAPGTYEVTLKAGDAVKAVSHIVVKEQMISVNQADELKLAYEQLLYVNNRLIEAEKINNLLGDYGRTNSSNTTIDSLYKTKRTQYEPITGKVIIKSKPRAWVTVDSVRYGLTPVTLDDLSVGTHLLEVAGGNYATVTRVINVEEDKVMSYSYQLKPLCSATIRSDKKGDQVYIDNELVGQTPLTIERPFGEYSLRITRSRRLSQEETITLSTDDSEPTFYIPLGDSVNITTGKRRANLYLDDVYLGRTPLKIYIPNGQHNIRADHGWMEGEREIAISKDKPVNNLNIETQTMSMSSFLSNGVFFMTGNLGLFKEGQPVWGFNIGDIGTGAGWYLSFMTNGEFLSQVRNDNFAVLNAYTFADDHGVVSGSQQYNYPGESSNIRFSAMLGLALKVAGPVYLRMGAGYGIRRTAWKTDNNLWVVIDPYSWKDVEGSVGLQCHFYNFVVNADALIPVTKTFSSPNKVVEFRVGLGFCLKHKR